MKILYSVVFVLLGSFLASGQSNLALNATASASASSGGAYGPANWTDGIINGATFGWVGTASSFTQPSWMQLTWTQPQSFNRIILHNVGTNFAPPSGNGVVFEGTANLEYWDGNAWQLIQQISGLSGYGAQLLVDFSTVSTTQLRIHNFNIISAHNPGFDEWEVFQVATQQDTIDAALVSLHYDTLMSSSGRQLVFSVRVKNNGNQPIANPEISYEINTNPTIGPHNAIFPISLLPGQDSLFVHPQTIAAEQILNGRLVCFTVSVPGDSNSANNQLCDTISGIGLSVSEVHIKRHGVYPIPARDRLFVAGLQTNAVLKLYDLQGRLLQQVQTSDALYELELAYPQGIYLLTVEEGGRQFPYRLLIAD
ncbi:MAG: T9SS type A sorting domain-containing protein [Bacteroidia bacterium]